MVNQQRDQVFAHSHMLRADFAPQTRRRFLTGLSAATITAAARPLAARGAIPPVLADWGDMELIDNESKVFKVHQLEQPLTLIVVWANWCCKCMRELTAIAHLKNTMGNRNLELILVSHPDDWVTNQRIVAERNLLVRCARPSDANNPDVLRRAFVSDDGVFYVPHSILFSRQQRMVVWNHIGSLDYASQAALTPVRRWLPA